MTLNFSAVLRHHAERAPQREVLAARGTRLSWGELDRRVDALAAALEQASIGRGDVVAVLLLNCPEYFEVIFAANRVGAAALPLNWRLAGAELRYILDDARAKALVSEPGFYDTLAPVLGQLPDVSVLLARDRTPPAGWASYEHTVFSRLSAQPPARVPDADVGQGDLHRLMYTSGTTAHPKGVMLSFGNLYWKNLGHIVEFGLTADDRTLVVGPLYHVGGLDLPATGVLHAGGSVVILPRFEPAEVLDAIERERPTNVWLAPAMVNALLQQPDLEHRDLSSLRLIIDGGEKMPMPLIQRLGAVFRDTRFADGYGLTETVSGDTFLDRMHTLSKLGSVGKPVVHLELKVVDDDGREVPPNEPGEIVLRGPKVFAGYWRNPEATAAAIRDGWFHTGDIGRVDEEGYLFILDRKKDMIISGGENIASPEVERVLYEHSAVLECAVVGRLDDRWGEVPVAFVVLKPGSSAEVTDLLAHCAGKLARFKVPKDVQFLEQLPRNPSGKVLKRVLRNRPDPTPRREA
jgi:acyl-CoA synthetase (AMP-forming)/AMP-acid ligase II